MNLREFIQFHKSHAGILTVAVKEKSVKIDLGVLESKDGIVSRFREKPQIQFEASMGIYCMEPKILEYIPVGMPFGFDLECFAFAGRDKDVEIARIGGDAFDRAAFAPELAAHDAHARAIVVGDVWNLSALDVLIAWRGHLEQ